MASLYGGYSLLKCTHREYAFCEGLICVRRKEVVRTLGKNRNLKERVAEIKRSIESALSFIIGVLLTIFFFVLFGVFLQILIEIVRESETQLEAALVLSAIYLP